jgi:glycosyltransferase involved in cell wall biosynthesis
VIASKSETQGVVVTEAMACGIPAIGADALAIPEIISDGENGYLFEPGNLKQLAGIMQTFEPTGRMRKNSRMTSEEYSVAKCTTKLEEFYTTL